MKFFISFLLILVCSLSVRAQAVGNEPPVPPSVEKSAEKKDDAPATEPPAMPGGAVPVPAERARPLSIPRFDTAPTIDGDLSDTVWQQGLVMKDFFQTQPGYNIPASRKTEVRVGYDAKFLYFAFHCFDEPDKIRATVAQRDTVFGEDNVRVFLDTFNDQRRAYVLGFNPHGIQQDGILTNNGGTDYTVDIVMESKGKIVSDGWVVEVAVPFKSLRYEAGKGKFWGFHVWRNIDRFNDEIDSWMPISREISGFLNQEARLTGLEDLNVERTYEIIPTLAFTQDGKRAQDGHFVNKPIKITPGLTGKIVITPNLTLDLAINPDFADVEADSPVVTTNQRFPIFFPERRPFFLEGKDIFSTPIQAVNTRSIVDPDVAVKLTGKRGATLFGILLASDNAPGNFSEEERNDPSVRPTIQKFLDKNAYIGALRVRRDIGADSSIGFIATTYNFIEKHNHLAGVDGRFRLDPITNFTFQVLGTNSRRNFYDPNRDVTDYRTGNGLAYQYNLNRDGRFWDWGLYGNGRTRNYRADVGFVRRTNANSNGAFLSYNSDPKPKNKIIGWNASTNLEIGYDFFGRSQYWNLNAEGSVNLQKQTFLGMGFNRGYERLVEDEFGPKRNAVQNGAFFGPRGERSTPQGEIYFFGGFTPSRKFRINGNYTHGFNQFDFDFGAGQRFPRVSPAALANPDAALDPGPGRARNVNLTVEWTPISKFTSSVNYNYSTLKRNDTGRTAFTTHIISYRATYQFTRSLFIRERLDYDTLSRTIRNQSLFGWNPSPGTAFYVGYNDVVGYNSFQGDRFEPGFFRTNRTFFIKMTYLIRRSFGGK